MSLSSKVWRMIAENRINEAIREGQFDELPGFGQPPDLEHADHSEHWWLRAKARRESLTLLPPALELARQVERRLARIASLKRETQVRAELALLNRFIDTANMRITWGPPSSTLAVDIKQFVHHWRNAQATLRPEND